MNELFKKSVFAEEMPFLKSDGDSQKAPEWHVAFFASAAADSYGQKVEEIRILFS